MGGRVADDAVFAYLLAASLELRLDEADAHCVGRRDGLRHREDMMQRDKRHIHAEKLNRLCQHIQRDIADVGALHVDDALVGAQAPCQLTVTDVHGIDLDRAVLQHTIGKAAGGRTNVHTDLAVRRQRKALHCLFQLEAAAADIADVVAAHLDLGVFLYHLTSLVHLLLVDKNDTGHDEGFGALTALDHAVLHQILVQTNFQSVFSPFGSASRTASARCAASRPVACLI